MLDEYRALVADKLRDTADKVSDAQRNTAITEAVKDYSRWRPRVVLGEITGDGAAYTFALPTGFEDGWSQIQLIEHPTDEQTPIYLESHEWQVYREVAGTLKLRFPTLVLEAAETAWVSFTARHTVDASTDTIPVGDRDLVASKATAILFRQLAALYTQTSDPTLGADVVNYRSKGEEYLRLAAALDKQYEIALGILAPTGATQAASAIGDLDVEFQEIGGPRFFHGNTRR